MKQKLLEAAKEIIQQTETDILEDIEVFAGNSPTGSKQVTIRMSFFPDLLGLMDKKRTKVDGMDVLEQLNK